MRSTKLIENPWLIIIAVFISVFAIILTPYPYTRIALSISGLIWLIPLLFKYRQNYITTSINSLLVISYVLFMINYNYSSLLGIREYLALILIIPYIVIVVFHLDGKKQNQREVTLWILIACIGILIKPSFIFILIFFNIIKSSYTNYYFLMISMGIIALPGFFLQFTTYLHRDMAGILYSAKTLIEGGVFGRDVIDVNPPLIWYLSYPVVFLSEIADWHPSNVFRITIIILTIFILLWTLSIIRKIPNIYPKWDVKVYLIPAIYVFFITSGLDMGQREYLALLLNLPYIAMAITRLSREGKSKKSEAVLVGIVAGIGTSIKPYFLFVPFFVEFAIWIITRKLSHIKRPEVVSGFLTMMAYGFVILISAPAYIFEIVPLAQKSYWAYEKSSYFLLFRFGSESLMALTIAALLYRRLRTTLISYILIASGFGFTISYFVQKKGFYYHEFPIRALAIMSLIILMKEGFQYQKTMNWKNIRGSILLGIITLILLSAVDIQRIIEQYHSKKRPQVSGEKSSLQDKIITFLNNYSVKDTFLVISNSMFPASPTLLYVRPKWIGIDIPKRYVSAIYKLRSRNLIVHKKSILTELEMAERNQIMNEMSLKPTIVLVPDSNILSFFLEDPKFQEIWSRYREIKSIEYIRVFERTTKETTPFVRNSPSHHSLSRGLKNR